MSRYKTKIGLLLLALLFLMYFSSDFALIDIQKTAIVVAIGIDFHETGFEVTAQIAVPQASDQSSANDDAVVGGSGKTIADALDNIGTKTGWFPKLSFCNLIVFGKQVAEANVETYIENLLSSAKIENSAVLAISDTTAKELLESVTPLDNISAFAIEKILLKNTIKANSVSVINLRKFAISHYSKSASGYMPIVKIVNGNTIGKQGGSSSEMAAIYTAAEGSSSSSSEEGSKDKNVTFDATETGVFSNGKLTFSLNKDETEIYNLIIKKAQETYIDVDVDKGTLMLVVSKNKCNVSLTLKEKPTVVINFNLTVAINDSTYPQSLNKISKKAVVPEQALEALQQKSEKTLKQIFEKVQKNDTDLFLIREKIYKHYNKNYTDLKKLPFSDYDFETNVTITSLD